MRKKRAVPRVPSLLEDMETEPVRQDWLKLTPKQRLSRAWNSRKYLKNPEKAHDERTLPEL